jgi:hypothetical protein
VGYDHSYLEQKLPSPFLSEHVFPEKRRGAWLRIGPGSAGMKSYTFSIWVRLGTGALAALVVSGLLTPSAARASCGDYLVMKPGSHSAPSQGPGQNQTKPERQESTSDPVPQPLPPGPSCPGSQCSRENPQPPAPTPPPRLTGEQWAVVLLSMLCDGLESTRYGLHEQRQRPVHHPLAIYHPPRPAGTSALRS